MSGKTTGFARPIRTLALPAGGLYIAIILLGMTSEIALRGPLIAYGDAAQTAVNILANETAFRLSLLADLLMAMADVALAVLLCAMFWAISPLLAVLATAFRLMQAATIAANLLTQQSALLLLTGPMDPSAAAPLALHAMTQHAYGYDLGLAFFALNSALLGLLLIVGRDMPAWLGVGLIGAGAVYATGTLLRLLAPSYFAAFTPAYALPLLAETAMALWLLWRAFALKTAHHRPPLAQM
ncbi:DUF4386 domain-containing protein [Rhodobacteraceae bacterium D3-12]|nr:DUF4386 domain-containing protein [Rhodobacteraceae bacterium D3-12]